MAGSHVEKKLTAIRIKSMKSSGKNEDGGGLRLVVSEAGAKRWVVRVTVAGRRIERGLGSYPEVSLESARDAAATIRKAAESDIDIRAEEKQKALATTKFREMFKTTLAQREKQLSNAKHLKQWTTTMEAYDFPTIGEIPVADVTTGQILELLTPFGSTSRKRLSECCNAWS